MSQIIKLNIGGFRFETTKDTLLREPESMLARMLEQPNEAQKIQNGQELFVDRNGDLFHHVLNYLRDGPAAALPLDDDSSVQALLREADFYQLHGLVALIDYGGIFRVGDTVALRGPKGIDYFESVVRALVNTTRGDIVVRYCWMCLSEFRCLGIAGDKGNMLAQSDRIQGKIFEIDNRCAVVGFARSNIRYAQACNGFVNADSIVKIHMPQIYLKLKRRADGQTKNGW